MRALVVGGNGFIGSHLVDDLVKRGWEVSVLDLHDRRYDPLPEQVRFVRGDLNRSVVVREAVTAIDVVFHLAWSTIHEVSNRDPVADALANLIPSIRLMETCRQAGVSRVVFASSGGAIYGPAMQVPMAEDHPKNPLSSYGITKLAVEKYLHLFWHLYGLDYAVLRPSVPYGPRQNPMGKQGAVAVFLYRVARGLPISIWGDGTVSRDYFYIDDLTEALHAGATAELNGRRKFNIGGGEAISLNQLVERVEATVGKTAIVEYGPERAFDVPSIVMDTTAAKEVLQWHVQVPLGNGLAKTWEWMSSTIR